MNKIVVIAVRERCKRTGRIEEIASHGINLANDAHVVLPPEKPSQLGATFCNEIGEWVIDTERSTLRAAA